GPDHDRRLGQHRQHAARGATVVLVVARGRGVVAGRGPGRSGPRPELRRAVRRARGRAAVVRQRSGGAGHFRVAAGRFPRRGTRVGGAAPARRRDRRRRLLGAPQRNVAGRGPGRGDQAAADPAPGAGPPRGAAGGGAGDGDSGRGDAAGQLHRRRRARLGIRPQPFQAPARAAGAHAPPGIRRAVERLPGAAVGPRPHAGAARVRRDRAPDRPHRPGVRHALPLLGPPTLAGVRAAIRRRVRGLGRPVPPIRRPQRAAGVERQHRRHRRGAGDRLAEAGRPLRQHRPRQAGRPGGPDRRPGRRSPRRRGPRRLRRRTPATRRPAARPPRAPGRRRHPHPPPGLAKPVDLDPRFPRTVAKRAAGAGGGGGAPSAV
ncbi:MAG: D-3-phosphoglycerate dehydrogenase, partial [uncultured Thermomicrobiales bacterium]